MWVLSPGPFQKANICMARMKTLNLVYENISFFILYPECREIRRYILGTQAQLWLLSGTFRLRKEQDALRML